MLRRGLAALMMGVICAGSVTADDAARNQNSVPRAGLMGWLKPGVSGPVRGTTRPDTTAVQAGGIQRVVIDDAERQAAQPQVALTANQVADDVVVVAPSEMDLQPSPIEQAPLLPNLNTVSGPQYFSAVPGSGPTNPVPVYPSNNWQTYSAPVPVYQASAGYYSPISPPGMAGPVSMTGDSVGSNGPGNAASGSGHYPQTGAALYPAPIPGIPHQMGGTLIPNQAFHPHEMLYAHRYRAMYPPYYYKVNGGWMVTPFGVWSREDWKLQGTMVDVKYKSSISPFALYKRPVIR